MAAFSGYKGGCGTSVAYRTVAALTVTASAITAAPSPLAVCTGSPASLSATVPSGVGVDYLDAAPATTHPYTSPSGTVSIMEPTSTGSYYFYNWQTSTTCVSPNGRAGGTIPLKTPAQPSFTYQFYLTANGKATAAARPA